MNKAETTVVMFTEKQRKKTALFFLMLLLAQLIAPLTSFALTSGPSQPEMQKFEPAGATNMVDLFSGDLKYNIPLLDVDGYPVNLAYHSGTTVEEEASWVGIGWSLNPGAINRTLRGLPDEFDGTQGDYIQKTYSRKEFKKVSGQLTIKPTIFGWEYGDASLHVNVYKDNYYGIGASVGASMGFTLGKNSQTPLTAGLGINSDVRQGVSISPSLSISTTIDDLKDQGKLSCGFDYNTRAGLKNVTLGTSFSTNLLASDNSRLTRLTFDGPSFMQSFGQTFNPTIHWNTRNESYSFSLDLGPSFFGGYFGLGGTGSFYKESLIEKERTVPAFGYLNYLKGYKNENSLLDFNRERDGVFIPGAPSIAVPIATHDYFNAVSQTGSQQFRPYFGGNYLVFDPEHHNTSFSGSGGVTIGLGNVFKAGARIEVNEGKAQTRKWPANNDNRFLNVAEYAANNADVSEEPVYFKQVGEATPLNEEYYNSIAGDEASQVTVNDLQYGVLAKAIAYPQLKSRSGRKSSFSYTRPQNNVSNPLNNIKQTGREKKNTLFSYLTADQAMKYGLDKMINGKIPRVGNYRKAHHISEVTVTDNSGKRTVYGIPVYNYEQQEVNFSIKHPVNKNILDGARKSGLVNYDASDATTGNQNGRDWLFSKEITSPYPTSFLITGILSPDYVDKTGDGITDDDLGSAIKFRYKPEASDGVFYNWRAPYGNMQANFNEGFLSDPKDDKASFVFGQKELWYLDYVEGKTTIAVFETSSRQDGLGVAGAAGGLSASVPVKKLDRIRLYSKAEFLKSGTNATPIKTVNFEYDYSLYGHVLNNSGMPVDKKGKELTDPADIANPDKNVNYYKGKLTLKRVYFTFGSSSRGETNPYEFTYDLRPIASSGNPKPEDDIQNLPDNNKADDYVEKEQDRWGTYKKSFYNHTVNSNLLSNAEFPYTLQPNENLAYKQNTLTDRFASKWQLNQIITPTGSKINIDYESDDYAFVQDKKAMQMCFVKGVYDAGGISASGLLHSNVLAIELPKRLISSDRTEEFRQLYLKQADGSFLDKIFYKILVDLDNRGHQEFVNGYAEIDNEHFVFPDNHTVCLTLKTVDGFNPVSRSAWQLIRTDLPQYAYDNYDNSEVGNGEAAIRSIIQAFGNLSELTTPFEKRATGRNFGNVIDPSRSTIRLVCPFPGKLGGGSRVKKIVISDEWDRMGGPKAMRYGQIYEYCIKDDNGNPVQSTGVASYEPQSGNEENPFHEPVSFTEKVHWSSDRYHFIDKPFCESYFPAAEVGYSRVTVTAIGDDEIDAAFPNKYTGYIENEFYTARDFPTIVDYLPLDYKEASNNLSLFLFASYYNKDVAASQGFRIELNDMHGRQKAVKTYNKGGSLISSTEYFYKVKDQHAQSKELDNRVDLLGKDGQIQPNKTIGTEIEFTTDTRESSNVDIGTSIGGYFGGTLFGFIPIPFTAVNFNAKVMQDRFHSMSAVKVVRRFGVLQKVVTMQNGSSISAENILWDAETGEVVLTKNQNEFDDYTWSLTYPAHMAYERMGQATQNTGIILTGFQTGGDGLISPYTYSKYIPYLHPGDELCKMVTGFKGQRVWVMRSFDDNLHTIDEAGNFISVAGNYFIARSGCRNMPSAAVGTIVCASDPRVGNSLSVDATKKILDAKSVIYKEEWSQPVENVSKIINPDDYTFWSTSNRYCTALSQVLFTVNPATGRRYLFSAMEDHVTLGELIRKGIQLGYFSPFTNPLSTFFTKCPGDPDYPKPDADKVYYYLYSLQRDASGQYYVSNNSGGAVLAEDGIAIASFNFRYGGSLANKVTQFLNNIMVQPTFVAGTTNSYCDQTSDFRLPAAYCNVGDPDCHFSITLLNGQVNDGIPPSTCDSPQGRILNPYVKGILGNWRPYAGYVYTVNRNQTPGNANQNGGTDIRHSGWYSSFTPFWTFSPSGILNNIPPGEDVPQNDNRWVWNTKSVYFDAKGNEIENVDALNRYGSALFGYQNSLAIAVGANARRNEIAFDGFEDYQFFLQNPNSTTCAPGRHLDFNGSGQIVSSIAHTGKYSYQINGTVVASRSSGSAAPPASPLGYDNIGQYLLRSNELAKGFGPIPGKRYLLSVWVNDHSPTTNKIQNLQIKINDVLYPQANTLSVPVVEGWKKLDLAFDASTQFKLEFITGAVIQIDDLRLLPYDGHLSTFVYNDQTLKLMAQLDENNFATFYEYDEEGTPIRTKKETERGIMTLKESRQAYKKH